MLLQQHGSRRRHMLHLVTPPSIPAIHRYGHRNMDHSWINLSVFVCTAYVYVYVFEKSVLALVKKKKKTRKRTGSGPQTRPFWMVRSSALTIPSLQCTIPFHIPWLDHPMTLMVLFRSGGFLKRGEPQIIQLIFGFFHINHPFQSISGCPPFTETPFYNNVLLVKIEGPVSYTIYHPLPVVKGVVSNPFIHQPTNGKRTSMNDMLK